jgi:tetratricopeptide (TPR) repeat protein
MLTDGPSWLRYTALGIGFAAFVSAAMGGWHMLRVWDIVGPLHTAMFEHYLDGVEALNAHKWSEAEDAFHAVMEADPNSIRGKRYLAAAVAGRNDEAKLARAQAALATRDWPTAYRLAQDLQQSLFHDASRVISQQICAHVSDRVIEAQAALEAGETKKAQQWLSEAEATMPNRVDVALLKLRADSTLGIAGGSTPPPMGPVVRIMPRRGAKRRQPKTTVNLNGPLAAAISDFNDGNADEALAKLDASAAPGAQALGQNVRAFLKAYNTALAEHRNKRGFAAVQALNQAKALEAKIGGGMGKLAGLIDVKLADMYYVMGMQAYASGQFGEANEAWRQALVHVPQHALSKSKLDELDQKAKGMIDEAESMGGQDTEKAKSLLRDALQMVAAGSPSALRAQRIAASLP